MRPIIQSTKHYFQITQTAVAAAAAKTELIVNAVDIEDKTANAALVTTGEIVKAVYVEWWILGTEASNAHSSFQFAIHKLPGGEGVPSFAEMNAMSFWENKKNVLFFSQGLVGGDLTNPIPVHRGWIKIPKGKQRMGLNDRIGVTMTGLAGSIIYCGMAVYKSYS